ncbi:response regulator [Stutzerimonas urumqiensis]|uniref:Hpt domain-containing protein n=1 Tax=Stutzerimonas urumqiensis TaxID=638269 RepID=UPI003BACF2E1
MSDRHDYVALEWVKGEIAETLRQARQSLEAFVESPEDLARIRFCLTYIHQVHGTLQMVEFYGAALLAEEMEQLAGALAEGRVANKGEALEVLMQAILQLPNYLDRIQGARRDLPMIVLPLLNDLRAARGEKLLSETSLFSPDLSSAMPALSSESLASLGSPDLPVLLRKLRQMLQMALVGVVRNQDLATNLGYMARVFARLEGLCRQAPLAPLWEIASGVVEGIASGAIVNGSSVRTLLREVDKELKRLVDQGLEAMNRPASDELIKNLLFYVAKAPGQSPKIEALKRKYRLDEALPDAETVDHERARMAGPDRGAMRSVVTALCEELVRIKDSLDLFVRSDRSNLADLGSLAVPLKQIADTLAVLAFGQPRKIILDQLAVVQALAGGSERPTDAALMDIAGALLYVEATLAGMAGGPSDDQGSEESRLPTTDVGQIHRLVIREARTALEQGKDAIIEFIASQWNHEHLARVPELLTQARGGLAMIPLERAAALLEACNRYIVEQLLAHNAIPDWQSLDTLADAITSVEYYLERLAEDHVAQGELILDVAEESLDALGYPLARREDARPEEVAAAVETVDENAIAEDNDSNVTPSFDAEPTLLGDDDWVPAPLAEVEDDIDYLQMDVPDEQPFSAPQLESFELLDTDALDTEPATLAWIEELALPEVELPAHAENPAAVMQIEPTLDDVMAAPVQAINPPAQDAPISLLPPPEDEEPIDAELAEVFIEEAAEVLETIGTYLPRWLADSDDGEALTEIRRAFHTLKGSGRMVRALIVGELAWSIENLLNRVLDRSVQPAGAVQQAVADAYALVPSLVEDYAAQAQRQRADADELACRAHALARGQQVSTPTEASLTEEPAAEPAIEPAAPAPAIVETTEAGSAHEVLDPQLLDIFRNEAENHLDTVVAFLADCAQSLPQPVTDALQRALHTLKGSAHMAGILPMAEIATPLEKMAKEFKANHIPFDLVAAQLLREAEQAFRSGLERLDTDPLQPIEGGAELIERVRALHAERVGEQIDGLEHGNDGRDPRMISLFLSEGMNILLDAEGLLQSWREHPEARQELSALLEELTTLGLGAQMAGLPQVDALCQALLKLYSVAQDGRLAISRTFFDEAEAGHEALVGMMDQVAAGLEVGPALDVVERLEALFAEVDSEEVLPLEPSSLPTMHEPAEIELGLDDVSQDELILEAKAWPAAETILLEETVGSASDTADSEMVDIFLDEAVDLLDSAGQALERWLVEPTDELALSSLQRDLHTLKGGARMALVQPIGDLAHELESLYEGLVDRRFGPSPELGSLLQRSHDQLALQLEQLQAHRPMASGKLLIEAIQAFRAGGVAQIESVSGAFADDASPQSDETKQAMLADAAMPPGDPTVKLDDRRDAVGPTESLPLMEAHWETVDAAADGLERDPELVEIFLEEAADILESASGSLARWMTDLDNSIELEALQRDLHTLKGGARMAEISEIGDLAHELESLYEGLCGGRFRADTPLFSLLQGCHDRLADMLDCVRAHKALPDGRALIDAIRRFRFNPEQQLSAPAAVSLKQAEDARDSTVEAEILDIFVEEAGDLLDEFDASLARWSATDEKGPILSDLLRILHTLKGGARLAGQRALGDMAHDLEQLLGEAHGRGAPFAESLEVDLNNGYSALLASVEELRGRLEGAGDPEAPEPNPQDEPTGQPAAEASPASPRPRNLAIMAASAETGAEATPAKILPFVRRAQEAALSAAARRAPQELVKVPADLLEGLVNLAGETSIFRGRVEQQVSDVRFTLSEMEATIERVRDQLRRLDIETQAQILSRYQAEAERAGYEEFDPLEMDRHSQLQQLSRALFESASDLLDLKETLSARNRDAETLLLQQARVNTELQEGLMRTRMVPFDRLVPRLRRIVRQVASELGKQVEFIVGNADGEMDRTVLERIVAPLEHMLRNAVDHGIELADQRRLAGKPEQGTIRLDLGREGGDIVLVMSDDGAGINLDAVRRKAIDRGMMSPDSPLSDHEVLQFILESGFSTAERVTQISGRGVGMDVVHSEVKQLGGSMQIDSTPGQGTRFTIRLPFTVSVNRALMVYSGDDLYAIPLNTIEGIVRVSPYELESYYQPGAPRFEYAGEAYELRYLGDLLNNGQHPKLVGQSLPLPVILVRSSEHAVAVQVDSLAGSREIVVKSLGAQFASVHGISGATILGDGRVVVILDLLATIRSQQTLQAPQVRTIGQAPTAATEKEADRPVLAMVVDDSVTVRKVTSRLLERNGMNVVTAKDGVDAIQLLQDHRPDVMLLDIEMPRMDGFEVAALVRHDEGLKDLPIIMITSRTGEKHRERAISIGVNEYMGKPYQESVLLEAIQRLVHAND